MAFISQVFRRPGGSAFRGLVTVAIKNPADVSVTSSRNTGHRAVLTFAAATRAISIAGRFTHNRQEARPPMVTDPRANHQPLKEVSSINLPATALWNTNAPLCYMDAAIPCSNKGAYSEGLPRGGFWGGKFCACAALFRKHAGTSHLLALSVEILKRWRRRSRWKLRRP